MAPVILQTEVHCLGCARKIRKAIKSLSGARVENVWASPDTGLLVVIAGWADVSKLQSRIQRKIRRPVTIVSDGAEERRPPPPTQGYQLPPPYGGMVHLGPQHYAALPPLPPAYPYQRRYVPATARQYVPPGEPSVCFEDEQPGGCCVQ